MNPAGLLQERMTLKSFAPFLFLLLNVFTSQTDPCHRDEYMTPDGCCPMCKPGLRVYKNCTESVTFPCAPCTNGTFMDQLNPRPECNNCTECDEAAGLKTKTSCTTESDTVCKPVEGFYCSESKKDDCVKATKHTRCKPGKYISKHGTSSTDTECSTCSNGTFSDGMSTSCQNHTECESKGLQLLRAGNMTEDAQCGGHVSHRTELIICGGFIALFVIGLVCYLGWKFLKNRQQKRQSVLYTQGRVTSEELKELKIEHL